MQTVAVFKHWVIYEQRQILDRSPELSSTKASFYPLGPSEIHLMLLLPSHIFAGRANFI